MIIAWILRFFRKRPRCELGGRDTHRAQFDFLFLHRTDGHESHADTQALGAHRVYLAERQVGIPVAKAATRHAEDQREQFASQRANVRLEARTQAPLGDLLFAFDSSDLKPGSGSNLDRLVTFLKSYPDRNAVIEGHTDNIGNAAYNRDLSERRGESIRQYLMAQGIGLERLSASGLGQAQPLVDNSTDAGRQRNRRVEIIIDNPALASVSQRVQ